MCFARIAEESFPFAFYLRNASRLKARVGLPEILQYDDFREYERLSIAELDQRLTEEHERAVALDDKTLKATLFLSGAFSVLGLGLAVISSSSALLAKTASSLVAPAWLTLLFVTSVVYFIVASWVALGALRTYPRYGFGTRYLLDRQSPNSAALPAESLARQETLNILRHCRNEAVFQTVRNGLILLLVGILVSVAAVYFR